MKASTLVFISFFVVLSCVDRVTGQGQDVLLSFIDSCGSVTSIEYRMQLEIAVIDVGEEIPKWVPRKGGRMIFQEKFVRRDLRKNWFTYDVKENTVDSAGPMNSRFRVIDNEIKTYLDPNSPAFTKSSFTPANGGIGVYSSLEKLFGPAEALGFYFGDAMGVPETDMGDLLASCNRFEKDGTLLTAVDVFEYLNTDYRHDVRFAFDHKESPSMPSSWEAWAYDRDGQAKEGSFVWGFDFFKYRKFGDVFIPIEFAFRMRGQDTVFCSVDPSSVKLNENYDRADFDFEFPPEVKYYDEKAGQLMANGKTYEKGRPPVASSSGRKYFLILMGLVLVGLLLGKRFYRSRSITLVFLACILGTSGCGSSSEPEISAISVDDALFAVDHSHVVLGGKVGMKVRD